MVKERRNALIDGAGLEFRVGGLQQSACAPRGVPTELGHVHRGQALGLAHVVQ